MSNDPTEFDRFAEVARERFEGVELDRLLGQIDHAVYRRGKLDREPVWDRNGRPAVNDLALFLHFMRAMVAEHDGTPPPPDPLAAVREDMERRAERQREFVAKREARSRRAREEAMRTPIRPPAERPVAAAKPSKPSKPSKPKKAAEPTFVDPRQMSLF